MGTERKRHPWLQRSYVTAQKSGNRVCRVGAGGLAAVPVIKVATRSELATGEATTEELGWGLFHTMLDVASGRRRTWTERWRLHNSLALFNPAPVT